MSEPFVGEIRMFGGNFAPRGFAFCNGQLLAVASNDALFSLLGTIYGGDGRTTFGLPDLRGRIPIHAGAGPGLTPHGMGDTGGTETNSLSQEQLPDHTHTLVGTTNFASDNSPAGNLPAVTAGADIYSTDGTTVTPMDSQMVGATGSSGAVGNLMPFTCVNFIIALSGVYPSRS
jgi:microcystin-dependent protein